MFETAENKLKKMAENNKFEELMNNTKELERLSKIKDISEVLDVLNKYGYNGNKNDLERDLFEILQGLSEDDLKNISGGRILNKKYLAGLMGGLTMMGAMGLNTSAQVENQRNVKNKPETSFLNKVDKKVFGVAGGSFVAGGLFVEALNLLFRKNEIEYRDKIVKIKATNPDFTLTEEEQKIYDNTVALSELLLQYVENYIQENKKMPDYGLNYNNPEHTQILGLIKEIRSAWIEMYEKNENEKLNEEAKQAVVQNRNIIIEKCNVSPVLVENCALEDLFRGLPVGKTTMNARCLPLSSPGCLKNLNFMSKLWCLDQQYRANFESLKESLKSY